MVKAIVRDPLFLAQKSLPATEADKQVLQDLLDTLRANLDRCVGMAANMIGYNKAIIVFEDKDDYVLMLNPKIIEHSKEYYKVKEGCLSLEGVRDTIRYKKIKVSYENLEMKMKIKTYTGFTAQIIQHEIDHLNGIII